MDSYCELIDAELIDADLAFFDSIEMRDESWCCQYDHESKRHSEGLVHHEFVPPGETVIGQFYAEVLGRIRQRILRVRPRFQQNGSRLLLHGNVRRYIALSMTQFLAKHAVMEMNHHPYSPNLAPTDFFLFPKLKCLLKRTRFEDVEDFKKTVTSELKSIPKEDFIKLLPKLIQPNSRWKLLQNILNGYVIHIIVWMKKSDSISHSELF
ncbi:hypothetical protein AVEN_269364-1 [Araneus ventricosus]|uniref:Histone-lysine N-methyltransferase SETMAR n=1 Tax=Araneus ventricosus TaxID=182803 RepID=A0A4Y2JEJ4_ARAVE|nr:hypothetical protein AVEN_269364-1 [Araneus ventricosus]